MSGASFVARSIAAWDRFWFSRVDGAQLARVRVLLGAALLVKLTGTYGIVPRMWYGGGIHPGFPVHEYGHRTWWGEGGYSDPFIAAFAFHDLDAFRALESALFVFAVLFFAGAGGRVVGAVLLGLYALWFNASILAFSHNELLLFVSIAIIGLSPSTDRYSVDALLRARVLRRPPRPLRSAQPLRMLQVLVSTIYAFTVIAKLNKGWLTGIALHDALLINAPRFKALRFLMDLLPDHDLVYAPGMWVVLVIELFLGAGFWFRRTRTIALVVGLLFHLGIELTMDVGAYSFAICALYAAFFPVRGAAAARDAAQGTAAAPSSMSVSLRG